MQKPEEKVYVELPEEDSEPGTCGRLNKSMYETRGEHYSKDHLELEFNKG